MDYENMVGCLIAFEFISVAQAILTAVFIWLFKAIPTGIIAAALAMLVIGTILSFIANKG